MITHLAISDIPKSRETLQQVIEILGDKSWYRDKQWDTSYSDHWLKHTELTGVLYVGKSYSYLEKDAKLKSPITLYTYKEFLHKYINNKG